MELVYKKEPALFVLALIISILAWAALVVGTLGVGLIYLLVGFLVYLFAHSAFISWVRGNGVLISKSQYPDVFERYEECRQKLGVSAQTEVYIINSHGLMNALATRFLGHHFLVLYSEIVTALRDRPDALNFYIGHELGHIKRKHLEWGPVLWPGMLLPHLGTAYSRAREYTCDLHGLACCGSLEDAERALAVLASGHRLWNQLDIEQYRLQAAGTGGFWMSFHEFTADYPWLVKRIENVRAASARRPREVPRRSIWAFILACFVPRTGGANGVGSLIVIAYLGILAAIAIPAYQDYIVRAQTAQAMIQTQPARNQLLAYFNKTGQWPSSLKDAGYDGATSAGALSRMYMDDKGRLVVVMATAGVTDKSFYYVPYRAKDGHVFLQCQDNDMPKKYLPTSCR